MSWFLFAPCILLAQMGGGTLVGRSFFADQRDSVSLQENMLELNLWQSTIQSGTVHAQLGVNLLGEGQPGFVGLLGVKNLERAGVRFQVAGGDQNIVPLLVGPGFANLPDAGYRLRGAHLQLDTATQLWDVFAGKVTRQKGFLGQSVEATDVTVVGLQGRRSFLRDRMRMGVRVVHVDAADDDFIEPTHERGDTAEVQLDMGLYKKLRLYSTAGLSLSVPRGAGAQLVEPSVAIGPYWTTETLSVMANVYRFGGAHALASPGATNDRQGVFASVDAKKEDDWSLFVQGFHDEEGVRARATGKNISQRLQLGGSVSPGREVPTLAVRLSGSHKVRGTDDAGVDIDAALQLWHRLSPQSQYQLAIERGMATANDGATTRLRGDWRYITDGGDLFWIGADSFARTGGQEDSGTSALIGSNRRVLGRHTLNAELRYQNEETQARQRTTVSSNITLDAALPLLFTARCDYRMLVSLGDSTVQHVVQVNLHRPLDWGLPYVPKYGQAEASGVGRVIASVYRDDNGNGQRDAREPALRDIAVLLRGYETRPSDAHGTVAFDEVAPGTFQVELDLRRLPVAFAPSGEPGRTVKVLARDEVRVQLGLIMLGSLEGRVVLDANDDGQAGSDEPGIGGVVVFLSGQDEVTQSYEDGTFYLDNIRSGDELTIELDPGTLPERHEFVGAGRRQLFLDLGQVITDVVFLVREVPLPELRTVF